MFATALLARRGDGIRKLLEGDPVAIAIFATVIVVMVGIAVGKAVMKNNAAAVEKRRRRDDDYDYDDEDDDRRRRRRRNI